MSLSDYQIQCVCVCVGGWCITFLGLLIFFLLFPLLPSFLPMLPLFLVLHSFLPLLFLFLFLLLLIWVKILSRTQPHWWCSLYLEWIVPRQLNLPGITSEAHTEVHSHGRSDSNPIDNKGQPWQVDEKFLVNGKVKWAKVCEREDSWVVGGLETSHGNWTATIGSQAVLRMMCCLT